MTDRFKTDEALWLALIHTSQGISWSAWHWRLAARFAERWGPPEAVPEHWGAERVLNPPEPGYVVLVEPGTEDDLTMPAIIQPVDASQAEQALSLRDAFIRAKQAAGWHREIPEKET